MVITGIFFSGSDTGNTENIAKMIQKQLVKTLPMSATLQKQQRRSGSFMTFC